MAENMAMLFLNSILLPAEDLWKTYWWHGAQRAAAEIDASQEACGAAGIRALKLIENADQINSGTLTHAYLKMRQVLPLVRWCFQLLSCHDSCVFIGHLVSSRGVIRVDCQYARTSAPNWTCPEAVRAKDTSTPSLHITHVSHFAAVGLIVPVRYLDI